MAGKTCAEDLMCGIRRAAGKEMTDLEKKHTPVIDAPASVAAGKPFQVSVEVGKLLAHPNEQGHHFEWIELWSGDTFLARLDLTPVKASPRATFTVSLDHAHPLRALAFCNMHGTWEGQREISVT